VKVFISVDMEGATGVCREAQTTEGTPDYGRAVRLLRADVDAAIAGCRDAGADRVVVADAHDRASNLDVDGLPDTVRLASGTPTRMSMLHGLDESFDAALFLAYHAMAGTSEAVLDHTYTYDVFRVRVDEYLEVGEIGINAGLAGCFDVPVVFVSGDAATVAEAEESLPGVRTATVKRGTGRTAARLLPPEVTTPLIREGVAAALQAADAPEPLDFSGLPLRITFTSTRRCDMAALCPGVERLDARSLQIPGGDFRHTFRAFLCCLQLAGTAGQ
jgi:D-amino peptidase